MTRVGLSHTGVVRVEPSDPRLFETAFGHFTRDGEAYVITRPDTPRPWVNVICPGDYGLIVSQAGGGYSWKTHASLNRITRWDQDLVADDAGKFVYVRDEESGRYWSPTWGPVCAPPQSYECRHGMGYTSFTTRNEDIETRLTMFVPPGASMEVWLLEVGNLTSRPRRLTIWSYLEWCLGAAPDSHREFHRTFIETELDAGLSAVIARKRLWDIPNAKGQHWNRSWEGLAWHGVSGVGIELTGDKQAFLGRHGSVRAPGALSMGQYVGGTTGRWDDAVAGLCAPIELAPGEARTLVFTVGVAKDRDTAAQWIARYRDSARAREALDEVHAFWRQQLDGTSVACPDADVNLLVNRWLKYQTLSARLWGRTAYYQTGGAFGYRDQLQDSQVWLHSHPDWTKRQLHLHAAHQYPAGHVMHWWHPITEQGMESRYSDDLLWLPFVIVNYVRETGDFAALAEEAPFLGSEGCGRSSGSLFEHCVRAIELALSRRSPRGLPLIGTGDWNDGLSVTGWDGRGESVWVGMFLHLILREFREMTRRAAEGGAVDARALDRTAAYEAQAGELREAINTHGWDGGWYWAASCDDGTLVGSHRSAEGRIHLNPQTWSVLSGVVPRERLAAVLEAMESNLYREFGPLLLYPAYTLPDERIGYLTRYAPGVRENGGLYSHAAMWAIQMECQLKRAGKAWELFTRLCPVLRGMDPQAYQCEPYVTPGNVDGPDSPFFGRGGWTWYTGSSAWLYRVLTEWMMGIRPTWDGLLIDPCPPAHWNGYTMRRRYRGCEYRIEVKRKTPGAMNVESVRVDGRPIEGAVIPHGLVKAGSAAVEVMLGDAD